MTQADAPKYVLGHSEREMERLGTQARLIDPMTRRFFFAAGIVPGMRVLDVGSGAGHTAALAAELVGEAGEVVGVDRAPAALATARARVKALGLRNVTFLDGVRARSRSTGRSMPPWVATCSCSSAIPRRFCARSRPT